MNFKNYFIIYMYIISICYRKRKKWPARKNYAFFNELYEYSKVFEIFTISMCLNLLYY